MQATHSFRSAAAGARSRRPRSRHRARPTPWPVLGRRLNPLPPFTRPLDPLGGRDPIPRRSHVQPVEPDHDWGRK